MKAKTIVLFFSFLLTPPISAEAASITYDFTGSVIQATGIYSDVAIGTTASGTYTFDLANAFPADSSGTISPTSESWIREAIGGTIFGTPAPSNYVFFSTGRAGSATYTTAAPGAYESFSNVGGGSGGQSWQAQEEQNPTNGPYYTTSSVSLFNVNGAYSSDGLPIGPGSSGLGYFFSGSDSNQSFLTYRLTSLTPTPLPTTVWLMLSGLTVLWLTRRATRPVLRQSHM